MKVEKITLILPDEVIPGDFLLIDSRYVVIVQDTPHTQDTLLWRIKVVYPIEPYVRIILCYHDEFLHRITLQESTDGF